MTFHSSRITTQPAPGSRHSLFRLSKTYSAETLGLTKEEYRLYQRMIHHLPTALIQGGSFTNMIEKLWTYRKSVSRHQYGRILLVLTGRLLFEPFRMLDTLYAGQIRKTKIVHPPIFILGMYRSGTTHLHNLICSNEALAYMTNRQVANPESFISGNRLQQCFEKAFTPTERPLDSMKVNPESPQEHQFALLNMLTPVYSDYFLFPSRYRDLLLLSVIDKLPEPLQHLWKQKFMFLLQKITYVNQGKQLVLKNPHDTANIATLLALFPNAKFIFIHRNPENVLPSLINTFRAMMYGLQLEGKRFSTLKPEAIHHFKNVLTPIATDTAFSVYKTLMDQYFKEKHLIPAGNLYELSYQDLVHHPVQRITEIHQALDIPMSPVYKSRLHAYFSTLEQKEYKTNQFSPLSGAVRDRMHHEFDFVYDKLGYKTLHEG